jgi:hypothetical protein
LELQSNISRKTWRDFSFLAVLFFFFAFHLFCSSASEHANATMRFLLYPRTVTAAAARLSQISLGNIKASKAIISNSSAANDVSASPVDTTGVKAQSQSTSMDMSSGTKAWGQQCSPDCGCVVRIEAVIDPANQTFISASYTAKSIVTVATSTTSTTTSMMMSTNENKDGQQQQQQQQRQLQPMLTTKGRPMMTACECQTLHHLSQAVVHHLALPHQNKVSQIQNMLEFQSHRSSLAFRRTVLNAQELPEQDTHCFDVVEEALTALVKGRMPQPRRQHSGQERNNKPNKRSNPTHPSRRQWPRDDDDDHDNDDDALHFGQLWKDYRVAESSVPRVMSALMMFDTNPDHQEYNNSAHDDKAGPAADWVSYVDEIYNQEEEEERSAC